MRINICKYKDQLFASQIGIGLVEILIAIGLVGGLGLLVAQMTQNSHKAIKGVESNNDILTVLQGIQGVLSIPSNCTAAFKGKTARSHPNVVTTLKDDGADTFKTIVADSGVVYGQRRVKIKSYSLSDATDDVDVETLNTTHLVVAFDKGAGYNRNVSKRIPLKVELNFDGTTIKSCVSLSHTSDNIWSYASNQTDIFYNGGNVGIGIAAPTASLDLGGVLQFNKGGGNVAVASDLFLNMQGLIASGTSMYLNVDTQNVGNGNFYFGKGTETDSSTKLMTILNSGNIGIGTMNPQAKLDVAGTIKVGSRDICAVSNEGEIRYNSTAKSMQYCNGVIWKDFSQGGGKGCPGIKKTGIYNQGTTPATVHLEAFTVIQHSSEDTTCSLYQCFNGTNRFLGNCM